jgi:hypothetical protein
VNLLCRIEMSVANGKTMAKACKKEEIANLL